MEISGAIGATLGPFLGSSLNYAFGYEGPFIAFGNLSSYIVNIFSCIVLEHLYVSGGFYSK
jgi:hypothetical protein